MRTSLLAILLVSGSAFAATAPAGATPENKSTSDAHDYKDAIDRASPPSWAVELAASPTTFGGGSLAPGHPEATSVGTSIQVEYQPPFLQRFGVLGAGPVLSWYPFSQNQGVTSGFMAVWAAGGQARYQACFVRNQLIVPSIGYEVDRMTYGFNSGAHGSLTLSGPVLGLQVLLNWFDTKRSNQFYEASSISRSYLVGELRELSGSDGSVHAAGPSWFAGLRFEM